MNQMSIQTNASISSSANSHELNRKANCRGANPKVFDFTEWKRARYALSLCSTCPVRQLCLFTLDPLWTSYDGVSGGFVWLNGKPQVRSYLILNDEEKPYADFLVLEAYLRKRNRGNAYDYLG